MKYGGNAIIDGSINGASLKLRVTPGIQSYIAYWEVNLIFVAPGKMGGNEIRYEGKSKATPSYNESLTLLRKTY